MDKAAKRELVTAIGDDLSNASVIVVAHYAGLTVSEMQRLRRDMKKENATVKVAKNRLVKIAIGGKAAEIISPLMRGPTLLAYSNDPVSAPKAAAAFAKSNDKLVILGGAMGETALDANAVKSLATLPSLDELRAKIIGLVNAPATKLAQLANAPAAKLARVFGAYAAK